MLSLSRAISTPSSQCDLVDFFSFANWSPNSYRVTSHDDIKKAPHNFFKLPRTSVCPSSSLAIFIAGFHHLDRPSEG